MWNHRVIKWTEGDETLYRIVEVYYNSEGEPQYYCEPFTEGDSIGELKGMISRFILATEKEVLDESIFFKGKPDEA